MKIAPIFNNIFIKKQDIIYKKYNVFSISNPIDTVEFTGKNKNESASEVNLTCSEDSFEVKFIENLRCPSCQKLMLSPGQRKTFINDIKGKSGKQLVKALSKYEDDSIFTKDSTKHESIFRAQKNEIVQEIKRLALENPYFTVKDIVKLKGISCLENLIKEQLKVVEELESYLMSANITSEEYETLIYIIETYKDQMQDCINERFQRQNFILALDNTVQDKSIQEKINEIISKLPKSDDNIDSFFVKYASDEFDEEIIIGNLVANTIPTTEHLVPRSKNGKNNLANYICDCASCNSSRRNKDFKTWMKEIPDFEKNLQEYINIVGQSMANDDLSEIYTRYIPSVIKTISRLSNGEINLKSPTIKSKETIRRENEYSKILTKISTLRAKLEESRAEIEQLKQYPLYDKIRRKVKDSEEKQAIIQREIDALREKEAEKELHSLKSLKGSLASTYMRIAEAMSKDEDTRRLIKTKESLERQIKNIDEEQIKREASEIREQIRVLNSKLEEVKEEGIQRLDRELELEKQIGQLDERINKISRLIALINECEILSLKLMELDKQINVYIKRNQALELENQSIKEGYPNSFDDEVFLNYLHKIDLLENANKRLENNKLKKEKMLYELILQAKKSLEQEISEDSKSQKVRFYLNEREIAENENIISHAKQKAQKMKDAIAALDDYRKELNELLQGETLEDIQERQDKNLEEYSTISKIRNIQTLKDKLESLEQIYKHDAEIFEELKNYETMPRDKFNYLIGKFYY